MARREANPKAEPHQLGSDDNWGASAVDLEFSDEQGKHAARIEVTTHLSSRSETTPLFDGQHGNHYHCYGQSFLGSVQTFDARGRPGVPIAVVVNYNMDNRFEVVELRGAGLSYPFLAMSQN